MYTFTQEREILHINVAKFFTQFKEQAYISDIQAEYICSEKSEDRIETMDYQGGNYSVSLEEKWKYFQECNDLLTNFSAITAVLCLLGCALLRRECGARRNKKNN
jgi:hypothetical protein